MTAVLPSTLTYGQVRWRVVSTLPDTATDPDVLPDANPVTGTVTFTPSAALLLVTGDVLPVTVIGAPQVYNLDAFGVLRDAQGNDTVTLLATDAPGVNPTGWTWTVTYKLTGYSRASFSFTLPAGSTVDLTTVAPVAASNGVPIIQGAKGDKGEDGGVLTASQLAASPEVRTAIGSPPQARDGHAYELLACVIRNDGAAGNYWQPLPESTNHRPINITSVETISTGTNSGYIRVHHTPAGKMTVVTAAVTDETLARNGFHVGTSVTPTYTDIRISQSAHAVSDYVSYDGTDWVSFDGLFTNLSFTGGVLSFDHAPIPSTAQYAVDLAARGGDYEYTVSPAAGSITPTHLAVEIRDDSPAYADYVSYDGTTWSSLNGVFTNLSFTGGVLSLTHPAIPGPSASRVSLSTRGVTYTAHVSSATNPASSTGLKVEFRDAAGALVTTPSTGMRAYVSHGGGSGALVTTPSTGMRVFITHGGGNRECNPQKIDTVKYPSSNIWLFGFMGTD